MGDFVAAAWRDGVGPDDRARVDELMIDPLPHPQRPTFMLFACWSNLLVEEPGIVPAEPEDAASRILHAAAMLTFGRLRADMPAVQASLDKLEALVAALPDDAPHATAARAWADFALGKLASQINDHATAQRRFEAVVEPERPHALRIAAMLELAGVCISRFDTEPARTWARRAISLAEAHHRPQHAARARILAGLLDFISGDLAAMRKTLGDVIQRGEGGAIARLLLANVESGANAMRLLADGLRDATENRDPLSYALCILVGARRYAAMRRDGDALVTLSAGIAQLSAAPAFAQILVHEREQWREQWGARFEAAEKAALALLS